MGERILKFIEPSFTGVEVFTNVAIKLIGSIWDYHLILWSADAELGKIYIEGKT